MKRITSMMITLFAVISFSGVAQVSVSNVATEKQEAAKTEVLESYLRMSNSLILSDSVATAKNAAVFLKSLEKFRFKKLTLEEMNSATTTRAEIRLLLAKIAETTNINAQRKAFLDVSDKMWKIAKSVQPIGLSLYQQVCPMTGATWISKEREIKNPYYPKNMLTCGEIKNSI
ncbi:DUF3347 domain-containing protein [Pedobacter sp. MC2016-24]|uniref:DUF3347 domain-containing protein n=1 Tax=Pedobacter sp. MC2016-24 TaxID=2780090 RepID=UPI00187F790C|nr:DUF3347 domain-containing protein [Pedobacter sp. MC2016-24]MBE9598626.1 DUF3347 domain-containing protein [Pedobacter sp. MC2016-24]